MTANPRDIPTIFGLALEIASPTERDEYLSHACGGDIELRRRIDELLRDHFAAGDFLNTNPLIETRIAHPSAELGGMIGPYKLQERLGEGGMGIVYVASQSYPVRRTVALKIIKPGMDSREVLGRFQAERQILALLDHPCIAKVYDAGTTLSGYPYFVMELIRGVPITEYCDHHKLSLRERLELMLQVCQGVQHAHQKGIIHRDLKPQNVLVTERDGVPIPKLIDFGVAKALNQRLSDQTIMTRHTELLGTPLYMSPEQFSRSNLDIDTRSDVYALGILLYELLVGAIPFGDFPFASLPYDEQRRMVLDDEVIRPSRRISGLPPEASQTISARRGVDQRTHAQQLAGELDWIIQKSLEKDRSRRYGSAEALAADLRRYLADEPVEACPPSQWYQLKKLAHKHRLAITLSALSLSLIVMVCLVATGITYRHLRIAEQLANENARLARSERAAHQHADHQLAASLFEQSYSKCDPNDAATGLLWLSRSLQKADELGAQDLEVPIRRQISSWSRLVSPVVCLWSHPRKIAAVFFGSDGETAYSVSEDGMVRLIDLGVKSDKFPAVRYPAEVKDAALSPDGKLLAICGTDKTARLWNTQTGLPLENSVLKHEESVSCIAFSPDSQRIVTGSEDRTTRLWNATTGEAIGPAWEHDAAVTCVAFSPEGTHLAVGTVNGTLGIRSLTASDAVTQKQGAHGHYISSIQFSPDGTLVLTASLDRSAKTWHTATCEPAGPVLDHPSWVDRATFSPNGRQVVSICIDHAVRVWETATGEPVGIPIKHDGEIQAVQISPDGTRLLTAGEDWKVRLWDWSLGKQLGSSINSGSGVSSASFDLTGTKLVTGDSRGFVRVWDISRTLSLEDRKFTPQFNSEAIVISPDGSILFTVGEFEGQLWDLHRGTAIGPPMRLTGLIRQAVFSPDGEQILICTGHHSHSASLWNTATSELVGSVIEHPNDVLSGAFTPDGRVLITACVDHFVRFWDRNTLQPVGEPLQHPEAVSCLAVSPDGKQLVTGCLDGQVRRWDLQTRQMLEPTMRHDEQVWCVIFSADGNMIISGGFDHQVRFWNSTTGVATKLPLDHGDCAVQKVQISSDGDLLLACTGRNEAVLWNLPLRKPLTPRISLFNHLGAACLTPDGKQFAWSSSDKRVSVADIPAPIAGRVNEVSMFSSVVTGMALDESGIVRPIDEQTWSDYFQKCQLTREVVVTRSPQ